MPLTGRHALHVYESDAELAKTAAAFTRGAIDRGEAVVLIPLESHFPPLYGQLAAHGVDPDRREQLFFADPGTFGFDLADAEAAVALGPAIEELVRDVRKSGVQAVNVWRETPHRLLETPQRELFFALESRWQHSAEADAALTVLCAHHAAILDPIGAADLEAVLGVHDAVVATPEVERLVEPLDLALREILGDRMAGIVWSLADRDVPNRPPALRRVAWLRAQMPSTWRAVCDLARDRRG